LKQIRKLRLIMFHTRRAKLERRFVDGRGTWKIFARGHSRPRFWDAASIINFSTSIAPRAFFEKGSPSVVALLGAHVVGKMSDMVLVVSCITLIYKWQNVRGLSKDYLDKILKILRTWQYIILWLVNFLRLTTCDSVVEQALRSVSPTPINLIGRLLHWN